jgi:hypothetical protein
LARDKDIFVNGGWFFSGGSGMTNRSTSFAGSLVWGLFFGEELFKRKLLRLRERLSKVRIFFFKLGNFFMEAGNFVLGKIKENFHFVNSFLEITLLLKYSFRRLAAKVRTGLRRTIRLFNSYGEIDGIIDVKESHLLFSLKNPFLISWRLISVSSSMRFL